MQSAAVLVLSAYSQTQPAKFPSGRLKSTAQTSTTAGESVICERWSERNVKDDDVDYLIFRSLSVIGFGNSLKKREEEGF